MPDLQNIIDLQDRGDGNMGSLTFGVTVGGTEDTNAKARFWVPGTRYALLSLRVHFVGGSGAAPFVLNIDHGLGEAYDFALMTLTNRGTSGKEVFFRVCEDEMQHWIFDGRRGDMIVPTWTNPDDGNMEWGLTVFLYPIKGNVSP